MPAHQNFVPAYSFSKETHRGSNHEGLIVIVLVVFKQRYGYIPEYQIYAFDINGGESTILPVIQTMAGIPVFLNALPVGFDTESLHGVYTVSGKAAQLNFCLSPQ